VILRDTAPLTRFVGLTPRDLSCSTFKIQSCYGSRGFSFIGLFNINDNFTKLENLTDSYAVKDNIGTFVFVPKAYI